MSMLHKFATGDRRQATKADGAGQSIIFAGNEYTREIPNTEPTDTRTGAIDAGAGGTQHYDKPYTNWKSKYYATTRQRNLGAGNGNKADGGQPSQKADGTTVVDDTTNKWYNLYAMVRYRKILQRYTKRGVTNMDA